MRNSKSWRGRLSMPRFMRRTMTCLMEAGVRRSCSAMECLAQWKPTSAGQRPTISSSSLDREFMTCVDRHRSISSGVSGAPRQAAPIGSRSAQVAPRSRHPSEECVSYHGQAADTCLWPHRPGPDRWDERFSRQPPSRQPSKGTSNGRRSGGCPRATLRSLIGELRVIQPH